MKLNIFNNLIVAGVIFGSVNAVAADKLEWYGRVVKEFRYVTQDSQVPNNDTIMGTDVDGTESTLGAKGTFQGDEDSLKVAYKVELGINSHWDTATGPSPERIRIRVAKAGISDNWGTLYLGQDFTAGDYFVYGLDPFLFTSGQNFNLEDSYIVGGAPFVGTGGVVSAGTGYRVRGPNNDGIQYVSPNWSGLTYTLNYDTAGTNYDPSGRDVTYMEHLLNYAGELGTSKLVLGAVYGTQLVEDKESSDFEKNYWVVGGKYSIAKFAFSGTYGAEQVAEDVEYSRYMAALAYDLTEKWKLAFSYGNVNFGDTHTMFGSTLNGSDSQMAVGGFYQLMASTRLHMILVQHAVEREAGAEFDLGDGTADDLKNSGLVASLGLRVMF